MIEFQVEPEPSPSCWCHAEQGEGHRTFCPRHCERLEGRTPKTVKDHLADALSSARADQGPAALRDEAYDQIDRFLRNALDDDDYADYSQALDLIYTGASPSLPLPCSEFPVGGKEEKCDACNGTGLDPACREETCLVCGGTGKAPCPDCPNPHGVGGSEPQPLTVERIREVVQAAGLMFTAPDVQVARAIEMAHGIGLSPAAGAVVPEGGQSK